MTPIDLDGRGKNYVDWRVPTTDPREGISILDANQANR
jgi:hypothetical protein